MRPYAAAALAAVLVALQQWLGGAFTAEFDGAADEAAHFVSALLARDFLATWPADPIAWAWRFYDHYPKVAIGHWPPGLYGLLALWWLVFPVERWPVLLFNNVMIAATAGLTQSLMERLRLGWAGMAVTAAVVATPVVWQAGSQTMSDAACLSAGALVMWTLARWTTDRGRVLAIGAAAGAAMLLKGTAFALLPAIPVVLALRWDKRLFMRSLWMAFGLLPGLGWYLWRYLEAGTASVRSGGLNANLPWRIDLLPALAGWGVFALALAGLTQARRDGLAAAAAALVGSFAACSYFLRGIREPRHWIIVLPALAVLAAIGYIAIERRTRWAPLALLAALALFPFSFYRQQALGAGALHDQLASQGRLPARMLISADDGWREGPWIAILALRERRPASTVRRATKVASRSDWMGGRYQLLFDTPEAFARYAAAENLTLVVLDTGPADGPPAAHHAIAGSWVRRDPQWFACGSAGRLEAYCRKQVARRAM